MVQIVNEENTRARTFKELQWFHYPHEIQDGKNETEFSDYNIYVHAEFSIIKWEL